MDWHGGEKVEIVFGPAAAPFVEILQAHEFPFGQTFALRFA